jgi:hypothetical protein
MIKRLPLAWLLVIGLMPSQEILAQRMFFGQNVSTVAPGATDIQPLFFGATGIPNAQTYYFSVAAKSNTESAGIRAYMPYGATIKEMYVQTNGGTAGVGGSAVTLYDGGTAGITLATCTILSGATACTNLSLSSAFLAGDGLSVKFVNSSASTVGIAVGLRLTGLTAGTQILGFGTATTTASAGNGYFSNALYAASSSASTRTKATVSGTVASIYASESIVAAGAGSTFTLQSGGTPGTATCTVPATYFVCNAAASYGISDGNALDTNFTNFAASASQAISVFGISGEGAGNKMMLLSGSALAGSTTSYFARSGLSGTVEGPTTQITSPVSGVVTEIYVTQSGNASTGGTPVKLRIGGVDTAVTCTVLSGQSGCAATGFSTNVAKGDLLDLSFVNSSASSLNVSVSLRMTGVS